MHSKSLRRYPTCLLALAALAAAVRATRAQQFQFEPVYTDPIPDVGLAASQAGDIDGDGDPDLVVGGTVYFNEPGPAGRWSRTAVFGGGLSIDSLALGDVDGDGDLDIVAAGQFMLLIAKNDNGSGTNWVNTTYSLPNRPSRAWPHADSVTVGDIDNDGDLDVCTTGFIPDTGLPSPGTHVFRNDGTGALSAPQMVAGGTARDVQFGDVDGDGDLDLVIASFCSSTWVRNPYYGSYLTVAFQANRLLLNDGSGGFAEVNGAFTTRSATTDIEFGDVDGDGDLDLFAASGVYFDTLSSNPYSTESVLYLNDGVGGFTLAQSFPFRAATLNAPHSVEFVDYDLDGDLDIVGGATSRNSSTRMATIYRNDQGVFSVVSETPPTPSFSLGSPLQTRSVVADFDSDGDPDLATTWVEAYFPSTLASGVVTNLQRQAVLGPARIGQSTSLRLHDRANSSSIVLPAIAPAAARQSVPGLGLLGIDLQTAISIPWTSIPAPSTFVDVSFSIPNDPSLVGIDALAQALFVFGPSSGALSNTEWRSVIQ